MYHNNDTLRKKKMRRSLSSPAVREPEGAALRPFHRAPMMATITSSSSRCLASSPSLTSDVSSSGGSHGSSTFNLRATSPIPTWFDTKPSTVALACDQHYSFLDDDADDHHQANGMVPMIPPVPQHSPSTPSRTVTKESKRVEQVLYAGLATHRSGKGFLSTSKRSFYVLTTYQLLRFKSFQRARAEVDLFNTDMATPRSIDKVHRILSLRQVYGVHFVPTQNALRIEYLHAERHEPIHLKIMLENANEQSRWTDALRRAAAASHLRRPRPMILSEQDAQAVEGRLRQQRDIMKRCQMYRVLYKERRRDNNKKDGVRETYVTVLLVIGRFNFYLLPLSNDKDRTSYSKYVERDRYGLLTVHSIAYEAMDDTFTIMVRQVDKPLRPLVLVSTQCETIIRELRLSINAICTNTYQLVLPSSFVSMPLPGGRSFPVTEEDEELSDHPHIQRFNTLLHAHCAALNLNKARFDYSVYGTPTGEMLFCLLPPNELRISSPCYTKYEYLALLRSLRHHAAFSEIHLDNQSLHELELWTPSKDDSWTLTPFGTLSHHDSVLLNELFSLLTVPSSLRRVVLTNCDLGRGREGGQSALMAIGLAMRNTTCRVQRLSLGNNKLSNTDLRLLVDGIRASHWPIQELDIHQCGLSQGEVEWLLRVLIDGTPDDLEQLDISHNGESIDSDLLDTLLRRAKRLTVLRLRGMVEFDLRPSLLQVCRLQELDLGQIRLTNTAVSVLCRWMDTPAFGLIERLGLDDCGLHGEHLCQIMVAISRSGNQQVHLDVAGNPITKEIQHVPKLLYVFMHGQGPASLCLARTEWEDTTLREMIDHLRDHTSLVRLDLSDVTVVDGLSEDTIKMMVSCFERNTTLQELILDGLHSDSPVGIPISEAVPSMLEGLKCNVTLRRLSLAMIGMGDLGAYAMANVLQNNQTLRSIHMDGNKISVYGFLALCEAVPHSGLIDLPKPRIDLLHQLKTLKGAITDLAQNENETRWFMLQSSPSDTRQVRSRLQVQAEAREAAELNYRRVVGIVDDLLDAIERNKAHIMEMGDDGSTECTMGLLSPPLHSPSRVSVKPDHISGSSTGQPMDNQDVHGTDTRRPVSSVPSLLFSPRLTETSHLGPLVSSAAEPLSSSSHYSLDTTPLDSIKTQTGSLSLSLDTARIRIK